MVVEDYVVAMETLTRDSRFKVYCILYRRVITLWFLLGLILLIGLLFTSTGLVLFGIILAWFFVLALGLLGCLLVKRKVRASLCGRMHTRCRFIAICIMR
jgi:hypothetical protein